MKASRSSGLPPRHPHANLIHTNCSGSQEVMMSVACLESTILLAGEAGGMAVAEVEQLAHLVVDGPGGGK
jgi:hypothetical protein